jgi:tripartite-type tricarboxylate transporter receptor subunit TctC
MEIEMHIQRVLYFSAAKSKFSRGCWLIAASLLALAVPAFAAAQTPGWPLKPVRIITGWTPGGNADALSRLLAERVIKRTSYPVIVDNRPGAAGTVAGLAVVRAEPDGHTLLVASMAEVTVVPPASVQSMQYDPEKELQPITLMGKWPLVLVANASLPANTMAELVELAKAKPRTVNYGSSGSATINHLTGELLNMTAGIDALHVPYKGAAPMLTDLAGGRIHFAFDSFGSTLPMISSGKIKPLAVTGQQRLAAIPNVPTTAEAGFPAVATDVWIGLFVPAKTPKNIVSLIHAEAVHALNTSEVRKAMEDRAMQPVGNTPEEFRKHIHAETLKKREIAARIGIKAE